jgi:ArsR family transcriptional regulator
LPVRTETLEGGELTVKLWLARKGEGELKEVKAA